MTGCPPPCVPLRGRPTQPQVVTFWMKCLMINLTTNFKTKCQKIPLKITNQIDSLDLMTAESRGRVPKLEAAGPLDGTNFPLDTTRTLKPIRLTIETLRIKESPRTPSMSLETNLITPLLLPQVQARRQDRRGLLGWSPWAPPRPPGSPPVLLNASRSGKGGVMSWSSQRGVSSSSPLVQASNSTTTP